jgi:ubiquitin-protein ligase
MNAHELSMSDPVYEGFMRSQLAEGMALSDASDILDLHVCPMAPPHYVAEFHCNGLIRDGDGEVREASEFHVGIWFPDDYLRRANTFDMLRMMTPHLWHPNVSCELPLICIGTLTPGTPLVDILHRIYEVLTYQHCNPVEGNALNKPACSWARRNQHMFPIDARPLKRRRLSLEVHPS